MQTTTLIKVLDDIRLNVDAGKLYIFVLLDLSAVSDTVHSFAQTGKFGWPYCSRTVIKWMRS